MIIPSRTREQIRTEIGDQVGMRTGTTTSAGNGGGTTMVDSALEDSDDYLNGYYVVFTSGANDGEIRVVDDYTGSSGTVTLRSAASNQVASGVTYELWPEDIGPERVNSLINRTIQDVTSRALVEDTDISLHAGKRQSGFDLPTAVQGVYRVEHRAWVQSVVIHNCEEDWDTADADVTKVLDDRDLREGGNSMRFQIAAGLSATDIIAYTAITESDISGCTHLEFWAKSSVALDAGDIQALLDDTAAVASPVEELDVPALAADTWTFCRVPLANPELDTALISMGLKCVVDKNAHFFWLDGIRAVDEDSGEWVALDDASWTIDKGRGELVLRPAGRMEAGYSLLKLMTLERPDLLDDDADVCEVNPEFVVARATAYALASRVNRRGGGNTNDKDMADWWLRRSDVLVVSTPSLPAGTKLRS
jgi:hypothetical protein